MTKNILIVLYCCLINCSAGDIIVTWNTVKDAEEYYIQYGTENVTTRLTTSGTQLKIENAIEGRTYFITVKSINKLEASKSSETLKFKVPNAKTNKPLEAPNLKLVFVK